MKTFLLIALLSSAAYAGGPKYNYPDPHLDDEMVNIYQGIQNPVIVNGRAEQITITTATISTATVSLVTISSAIISSATIYGAIIKGTTGANNAPTGYIGEYIESLPSATAFPTNATFGDLTSIVLTAGDWDVTLGMDFLPGTSAVTDFAFGATTHSGNDSTGISAGNNFGQFPSDSKSLGGQQDEWISNVRFSLSATTTIYYKVYQDGASVTLPNGRGRMSARRIR